jgi:hypothetical protein
VFEIQQRFYNLLSIAQVSDIFRDPVNHHVVRETLSLAFIRQIDFEPAQSSYVSMTDDICPPLCFRLGVRLVNDLQYLLLYSHGLTSTALQTRDLAPVGRYTYLLIIECFGPFLQMVARAVDRDIFFCWTKPQV